MREAFWLNVGLDELSHEEWEALCDGCGLCCLHKLEDEDTGDIAVTDVACKFFDIDVCRCKDYTHRHAMEVDCVQLDAQTANNYHWLPETCAYRRMAKGRALPYWHYLVSGDRSLVHKLEVSAKHQAVTYDVAEHDDWQERVLRWVDR